MEHEYTARDVQRITGLPLRTIVHWAENGVVVADIAPAGGKGSSRRYSRRSLFLFLVAKTLSRFGFRVPQLRACTGVLSGFYIEVFLLITDDNVHRVPSDLHVVDGQFLFLSSPDGSLTTPVVELAIGGESGLSSYSVDEVLQRGDAELIVHLDKRAAILKKE